MATFPWSILGISKTSEERAIKSAYARKLKETRPENDAAAFQLLVEARDAAVRWARRPISKKMRLKAGTLFVKKLVHDNQKILKVRESPDSATTKKSIPKRYRKPRVILGKNLEQSILQPDKIAKTIGSFLSRGRNQVAYEYVDDALASLRSLSIEEKIGIEADLLLAVRSNLVMREERPARDFPENKSYDDLCRLIMSSLDSEFEWTQNDRRTQELLGWGSEDFVDQLQSRLNSKEPILAFHSQKRRYWWLGPAIFVAWLILKSLGVFSTGN